MISDRLRDARLKAGYESAAAASARFGWKPTTYAGHENGSREFSVELAETYGRAFRVAPEWILVGRSSQSEPQPVLDVVPIYNVFASAGHGALPQSEEIIDHLSFPPGYLRHVTKANPKDLAIIGVKGDSMLPTLKDDDVVMLDRSKTDLSYDGLFVIRDGGDALLVKRITRAATKDHVLIKSDNAAMYPPVERHLSGVHVVGKVIWMGVKV